MEDQENFMSWTDVAKLHEMGFEIGNHTWNHGNFNTPESVEILGEELVRVEDALAAVGVPRPVSFGWPGNEEVTGTEVTGTDYLSFSSFPYFVPDVPR